MPYIKKHLRPKLIIDGEYDDPGILNYLITMLLNAYVKKAGLCYDTINDVIGALESSKLEFYRRVAAPYEDKKIKENGDVYDDTK